VIGDAPAVKLTANERRSLAEFAKPEVDWDKVHGRTLHALQRKKLIEGKPGNQPGWQQTAAGRAALAVPNIFDDLFDQKEPMPKTSSAVDHDAFREIESVEVTLHDPVRERFDNTSHGVRLYRTASPLTHGEENARWSLQVRAQVRKKIGGAGKQFAIGTASVSREDLVWLRDQINAELRRKS
jgi:hypothetical protein